MRDSCPEKTPEAKRTAPPSANTAQPPGSDTDAFGPWMVVERRQRRPARNMQTNGFVQAGAHPGGSRFNPISEELVDAQESARDVDPAHEAKKQRVVHVRKPLTVTLNDFPIVTKSATKASSSCSPQLQNNTSKLDKARHSSIMILKNLDPNMKNPSMIPHVSPACNNSLGMRKPPDPHLLLHLDPGVNNICEKPTAPVLSADSLLVVQDSAMVE
ncbi:hypothetical protein V6N13_040118 [Hibiscus sabdariffa]